jgi:hypothetical protein
VYLRREALLKVLMTESDAFCQRNADQRDDMIARRLADEQGGGLVFALLCLSSFG